MPKINSLEFEGKSLPFSNEAEQSVIGSILLDPASRNEVFDRLRPECFYIPQNRKIYEALSSMDNDQRPIDFITLLEYLRSENIYDEVGGKAYLTAVAESVPSSANINTYANIVRDRYYMRSLITASRDIIEKAGGEITDSEKLIDYAEQSIFEIRQGRETSGLTHISDVIINETYDRLAKITNPETKADYEPISTGISGLDKVITGLNKSDLIILGARPGMGKTAFALNITRNVAVTSGKTVCFFSLEMTRDQLAQRMLSADAAISSTKLRTGELSRDEFTRLTAAGDQLKKANIYFDETSGITVPEMKAKLRRLMQHKPVDLVVIDYLGLMQSAKRTENRVQEVSDITRNLKIMAKELRVPVIACAQLSRGTEAKGKSHKPALADLRESGSIEQDADIVLFLYREKYYESENKDPNVQIDEHKAECIVAKNRHGGLENVELYWDGDYTRFTSPEKRYE